MDTSSDDSDYVPEIKDEETNQSINKVDLTQAEAIYEEIKKTQQIKPEIKTGDKEEALNIAKLVTNKMKEQPKVVSGMFAGEKVSFELGKRGKSSIDQILADVKKPKSMNCLSKSTLDWEKFRKTSGMEDSLEKNRKDGFIAKKNFLLAAKEKEKDQISSLKRKKFN